MFGKLKAIKGDEITIKLDDELNIYRLQKFAANKQPTIELQLDDGRQISPDQRKKIFAMLRDMAMYTGYDIRDMEQWMKYFYYPKTGAESFSMSDCSMDQANKFLTFILDFCFENGIPFKTKTWDMIDVDYHLTLECIEHRKCIICGKHADLHHVDVLGNRSRKFTDHRKFRFLPLCRIHHQEAERTPALEFAQKYQIKGIQIPEDDLIKLHIMTKKQIKYWNERYEREV